MTRISIFLSLYFSISLSTLRSMDEEACTWGEWYSTHPNEIPLIALFQLGQDRSTYESGKSYHCKYSGYEGQSLPYTKVSESQLLLPCQFVGKVQPDDLMERISRFKEGKPDIHLGGPRFLRKTNSTVETDVHVSSLTEYKAGELCAYLEPIYSDILMRLIKERDKCIR